MTRTAGVVIIAVAVIIGLVALVYLTGVERPAAVVTPSPTPTSSPATAVATFPPTPTPTPPAATPAASTATTPPPAATPPGGATLQFLAVQRLDARTGWASARSGGAPVLLRTSDGGATWERLPLTQGQFVTHLSFIDAQSGWAIGRTPFGSSPVTCRATPDQCRSLVLTSGDGGRTWTERFTVRDDPDRGLAIIALAASDRQRAWITVRRALCDPAGCAHEIRGSEDGGATWKVLRQPQQATQLGRASATQGWALGPFAVRRGGEIIGTRDGGTSWTSQFQSELSPSLLTARANTAWSIFFDPAQCTASACTGHQLMRATDGATWTGLGNPVKDGCGGHLGSIAFGDAQTGWITVNLGAGGASGTGGILRTTDGGRSWTCRTDPSNTVLLSAADARHVWVTSRDRVSGAETLLGSDDGGQTWQRIQVVAR